MNKNVVRGLLAVSGLACAAFTANAQAPTSAQQWEVRFVIDQTGDFAEGPNATAVGITMQARIGLRANTVSTGSLNFGVSRVGGSSATNGTGFLMTFNDPTDSAGAHGSLGRGATGEAFNDASGASPLAGHFAAYRGSFSPSGTNGFNTDASNGTFGSDASGHATATNIVGSRASGNGTPGNIQPDAGGYNGDPSTPHPGALGASVVNGDGTLTGDFTNIFRFIYTPRFQLGVTFPRLVNVTVANMQVRYLRSNNGSGLFSASANFVLPTQTFSFQVPGPGAAALVGMGGLLAARRRRA